MESNGKLPHLLIPSKTATLVPEFTVRGLALGRTAALVPEFSVKDLPLGRTLMMIQYVGLRQCVTMATPQRSNYNKKYA